ncbi:MAG: hypothetical protein VX619_03495 [bacterium]|nr:hypothetical protein [bacterium]
MFGIIGRIIKISILFVSLAKIGAFDTSTSSTNTNNYESVAKECKFYENVLEERYPCGEGGYAIGYGGKYCRAFDSSRNEFTEKGNKWRIGTMKCLINSLRKFLLGNYANESVSCDEIKEYGFDTHPTCYTAGSPSFCDLNIKDYKAILGVIQKKDLLSKLGRKQIAQVARICLRNKIENDLDKIEDSLDKLVPSRPYNTGYSSEKIKLLEEIANLDQE